MGVVNIVSTVKQIHKEYIVLVKIGKFYSAYGKDAVILSYIFQYKVKYVENNIQSVGFSEGALNKVLTKLEEFKINYLILDRRNDYEVDEKSNNKNLNKYKEEVNLKEYETFEEAKMALFEFIEGWYNRKRIHSAIGYQIPYDIEKMSA